MHYFARATLVGVLSIALLGPAIGASAHTTSDTKSITGTITAMSGTDLPAVLTILVSGGVSYTVNITSITAIVRKFNGPSALDEFAIGDIVTVTGHLSGTTFNPADRIKNASIQRKGAAFWGTVLSIDASAKSFVLDPKHRKSLDNQNITTSSATKVFQGNRPGVFTDLAVGMTVKVIGVWRKLADTMAADRILIRLTTLNGEVTAVDCDGESSVQLEARSNTIWTAAIDAETTIRDRQLSVMPCSDVKVGHKVQVRGLKTGDASLLALNIWDKGAKRKPGIFQGKIESLNTIDSTFVLDVKNSSTDLTVQVTAETILVNRLGVGSALITFAADHDVRVWGVKNGTTVTANLIMNLDLP